MPWIDFVSTWFHNRLTRAISWLCCRLSCMADIHRGTIGPVRVPVLRKNFLDSEVIAKAVERIVVKPYGFDMVMKYRPVVNR